MRKGLVTGGDSVAPSVRWGLLVAACGTLSALAAVGLAAVDSVPVEHVAELARVTLGEPLGWLVQDQSASDGSLPTTARLASPWEHPVSVDVVALLIDVVLVTALLVTGWLALRVTWRVFVSRPR